MYVQLASSLPPPLKLMRSPSLSAVSMYVVTPRYVSKVRRRFTLEMLLICVIKI